MYDMSTYNIDGNYIKMEQTKITRLLNDFASELQGTTDQNCKIERCSKSDICNWN